MVLEFLLIGLIITLVIVVSYNIGFRRGMVASAELFTQAVNQLEEAISQMPQTEEGKNGKENITQSQA